VGGKRKGAGPAPYEVTREQLGGKTIESQPLSHISTPQRIKKGCQLGKKRPLRKKQVTRQKRIRKEMQCPRPLKGGEKMKRRSMRWRMKNLPLGKEVEGKNPDSQQSKGICGHVPM